MTFTTIESSILWPERVGVKVEDVFVCEATGTRALNQYQRELLAV
jgi:Xaa-Pro aminopeptidase